MPFFMAMGHRLTKTEWKFRGNSVRYEQENHLIEQLRIAQANTTHQMQDLHFCKEGGVISSNFRTAVAPRGLPQYKEYRFFNESGATTLFINSLVGYSAGWRVRGVILVTTGEMVLKGYCNFSGSDVTVDIDDTKVRLEGRWNEGRNLDEYDEGWVYLNKGNRFYEQCRINGLCIGQELGGMETVHRIFNESCLLGCIHPDGKWQFGLRDLYERFFKNNVPVLEYTSSLSQYYESSYGNRAAFLIAVAMALGLYRRVDIFVNS